MVQVSKRLPIEQNIGLCVLYNRLMDFCDVLVIKLVPLAVDHILTVSYVVSTCRTIENVKDDQNKMIRVDET